MTRSLNDVNLTPQDSKLLADVQNVGWHVVVIHEEKDSPGWAFSVGLHHNFNHPEIVVFGAPQERAAPIVNNAALAIQRGQRFDVGQQYPDILTGYEVTFQPVELRWKVPFLGYAVWFYGNALFPARQCFWPDRDGWFPWDDDFDEEALLFQPLLYLDDPEMARATELLKTILPDQDNSS